MKHTAPTLRAPELFHLPIGYRQQTGAFTHDDVGTGDGIEYWNPARIAASAKYQHHVYRWAAELVKGRRLKSVLDIGCGPGTKLKSLIAPVCGDIVGFDQPSGVRAARANNAPGRYYEVDLEHPTKVDPERTFDLIICADVIEHLIDPDPALVFIRDFCHATTLVLISTPDRARLRGRNCMASEKVEHVREWTGREFDTFLRSRSYRPLQTRRLPADERPRHEGWWRELLWRMHLSNTSPLRCNTVLCSAIA